MGLLDTLKAKRREILAIVARHGGYNVRVFGSVLRGEENPQSDIDLLVSLEEGRSLIDYIALVQDLEAFLGRKVDVAEPETVHWYIRDQVLGEAMEL